VSFNPRALSRPSSMPAVGSSPYSERDMGWSKMIKPTSFVLGKPAKLANP